jgi:hypothetical protein
MTLTDQQKQQVMTFLKSRVGNTSCPECQNSDLHLEDHLSALVTLTDENKAHPVLFVPMVPLVCRYCGYARLFSAKAIGLVK